MLGRAWRWVLEQAAFLLVLGVLAASFVYLLAAPEHWRRGTTIIAVSMVLAGVLRAALPPARAGMLVVRRRSLDAAAYLLLGGLILAADIRLHS